MNRRSRGLLNRFRLDNCLLFVLMAFLLLAMPGFAGEWTLIAGKHLDVLVNLKTGEVRGLSDSKTRLSGLSGETVPGALVSDNTHVWTVNGSQLVSLVDATVLHIPGISLLPQPSNPTNYQHIVIDNRIQIPMTEGVAILDTRTRDWRVVPVKLVLSEQGPLAVAPEQVYLGDRHVLKTSLSDISILENESSWRTVAAAGDGRKLHAMMDAGERWITLAISGIGTDGLGSFDIRVLVVDRQTGKLVVDRSDPGVLRALFVDQDGRPTIYYAPASILAALFNRDEMFLRALNPENGSVLEQRIKLTHKRRHILPILNDGSLELVVHCRDGRLSRVNPRDGSVTTLQEGVSYEHRIARFKQHLEILDSRSDPVGRVALFPAR